MVSLKPRILLKHRRGTTTTRPKQEQLGRSPALRASKLEVIKKNRISHFFSTLRSSVLSQNAPTPQDLPQGLGRRNSTRRNIIRVSRLNFDSVNIPPLVISGPSLPTLNEGKPSVFDSSASSHISASHVRMSCNNITRQMILSYEASPPRSHFS